jgi:Fe-S cluster biogenesis protein NfuA
VIEVRLKGTCNGCPMATLTLKAGIERLIKEEVPEVKEVIAV